MLYECHITVPREHAATANATAAAVGWKFSQIDGDPVLGKAVFAYLTTYDDDYARMVARMDAVASALTTAGCPILRRKIEAIVFDSRTTTHSDPAGPLPQP